jgi:hypothetical protein
VIARADELGLTSMVLPVAERLCGRVDGDRRASFDRIAEDATDDPSRRLGELARLRAVGRRRRGSDEFNVLLNAGIVGARPSSSTADG